MTKENTRQLVSYVRELTRLVEDQKDKANDAANRGWLSEQDFHSGVAAGLEIAVETMCDMFGLPEGGAEDGP